MNQAGLLVALLLLGCASEAAGEPARLGGSTCPSRMAHLPEIGACIDRYEAVVEGRGEDIVAEPAEGRLPTTAISWHDAVRACRNAGLRLCSSEEWFRACSGSTDPEGGRTFAYGDAFEEERCNSGRDGSDLSVRRLAEGGAFERCVTPEGVYDLAGNLGEWLSTPDPTGTVKELRGGSYANYERETQCVHHPLAHQPADVEFDGMGFRCCTDAR